MKLLNIFYLISVLQLTTLLSFCQNKNSERQFNLGFEKIDIAKNYPESWIKWGKGYKISLDSTQKTEGKYSLRIEPSGNWEKGQFGCPAIKIPAKFKGEEIELTGYLKFSKIRNGAVGLLLRIDGREGPLKFNNMQSRNISGTADWNQFSVKLKLPEEATAIFIGAINTGTG